MAEQSPGGSTSEFEDKFSSGGGGCVPPFCRPGGGGCVPPFWRPALASTHGVGRGTTPPNQCAETN
eukprot:7520302-Heterocapsa_arctica.AAC.1